MIAALQPGQRARTVHGLRPHGLQHVDTGGGEPGPRRVVDRHQRPQARSQRRLLIVVGPPGRLLPVEARHHAGRGGGRREALEPALEPVVGQQLREVHHRVLAADRQVAHAGDGPIDVGPFRGRIQQQQRAALPAVAAGDHQRARAYRLLARQRRQAQEIEGLDVAEREKPGALGGRAN